MNTIVVKTNNATQTVSQVQIITKDGVPTVIAAEGQVNYEFHDTSIGYAPNHIVTKRIKNDLHVSFEKEGQDSDLIIEGFYNDSDSALVGIAEDGEYYYYIPDTGETYDYVTQLEMGDVEGQALGGQDYIAAAIPWWIPVAAGLGLAGIVAAVGGKGDDNINDVNDAPVATDGAISTPEGTAIAVPLIASDIDGVVASITLTTLPDAAQGVLSYTNAAGDSVPVVADTPLSAAEAATVLFTPTENFNGAVEAIDFIATDDDGLDSAPATVTLTVTDVNTPPTATDQSLSTDEDTAVPVVLIGDDIDGVVASVTVLQVPPANQGVLSYEDNGQTVEFTPGTVLTADQITSVMFTPAPNFNGRVSNIQFSTTDDDGAVSAPATVEITVNDVNDAPVATDGAISTPEGTAIAVPLIASDIDGVVASITLTTLPDAAQGVLSYTNAAGDSVPVVADTPLSAAEAATVLFTPTENFNGAVEAIDFIATDDDGLDSAPATVTLTVTDVNTPPTATDQSLSTDEDTAVPVVLIGDDIDGVVASVTVLQVPPANQGVLSYTRAGGQVVELTPNTTLSAAEAETVTFTPAPNFNGAVSDIQFTTTDDDGAVSAPATVEITVNDVNDAPVATDGAISTPEGTAIAVPLIASDI
ncbi:tandem-95 repeat protein, partial [Psychrobacter sp. Arc9]|uniref:tandem-95 repeat protein n=1 Tax=Psychrobacter sp. Arc9 TaxID=3046687 RepID=UPI00352DB415